MADSTSGAFLDSSKDTLEDSSSARILSSRELQEPRMEVKKAKGVRGGLEVRYCPRLSPTTYHTDFAADKREAKGTRK